MATQDELKQQVAKAAVEYVKGGIIGVGTGSTANFFIDELAKVKSRIDGTVASSEATARIVSGSSTIGIFTTCIAEQTIASRSAKKCGVLIALIRTTISL